MLPSRNTLLDTEHRAAAAPHIYATLKARRCQIAGAEFAELKAWGHASGAQPAAQGHLLPVGRRADDAGSRRIRERFAPHSGCIAVCAGNIRLIDKHPNPIMKFQIEVIKSKIHCVTVTQADLNYVGRVSPSTREALMEAANMIEGEKVCASSGHYTTTESVSSIHIIKGERGSGCICSTEPSRTQGAGKMTIIIASYALMDFEDAPSSSARVFPDTATNRFCEITECRQFAAEITDTKSPRKREIFRINRYLCKR